MYGIEGVIVFVGKVPYNALGNGHAHPKHINEDEELILHHAAERNQKVIFNHVLISNTIYNVAARHRFPLERQRQVRRQKVAGFNEITNDFRQGLGRKKYRLDSVWKKFRWDGCAD